MFCINCGAQLPDNAKFCMLCGAKMDGGLDSGTPKIQPAGTRLVAANCTNCGAALKVDPNQEAAICPFCSTPYIVEKAIQNYKITNNYIGTQINIQGVEADNLIDLSESALKAGNYLEALQYAERALEMDPSNIDAWIVKIKAAGNDIKGDRSSEISTYIDTALERGADEGDEVKLYTAVFDVAENHIYEAIRMLGENQDRIQKQVRDRRLKSDIAAMDSGYVASTAQVLNEAMEYRSLIPDSIVAREEALQERARHLADICKKYYEALQQRYNLYNGSFSYQAREKQNSYMKRILAGTNPKSEGNSNTDTVSHKGGFFSRLFS